MSSRGDLQRTTAGHAHFAILLELLRGNTPTQPPSGDTWAALIRLAREHMLLLALKDSITALHLKLPFIAQRRLLRAEREQAAENLRLIRALQELIASTTAAGLRIVPLKGPALLERLYNDPNRRPCADLDFVVHPADIPRLHDLLTTLGYRERLLHEPAKWTWESGAIKLELHGEFDDQLAFPHNTAAIWSRIQPSTFRGQPTWRLHPADELVFLCLHAARHRFCRLGWTVELARTFEILTPEIGAAFPPFHKTQPSPESSSSPSP